MEVLHWRQKGFAGREFLLNSADDELGKLVFKGWSSYDAVYTSGDTSISFTSKGWFDQDVQIVYNGQEIGTASVSSLTGKTQVRLLNGEFYTIKCDMFSYNRQVMNEAGETLLSYKQGAFSFGKGTIEVSDALP